MSTIGIIGGTGPAGRGLAVRLAHAGHHVIVGSRDADRAQAVAAQLDPRGTGTIRGATNDVAAAGDVVVVATPWESTIATARALRDVLAGRTVVSMVNALSREGRELVPYTPPRGSMAAELAATLPASAVVGAFHHLPAALMEDLDSGLDADVVVVGDDEDAVALVADLIDQVAGLHAVVAGSLSLAGAVEAFTAVCISVNIRHRVHSYVRLAGLSR
ncbi:MAG: NADPH-dependent F420 reductase [Acidimicrobiales bacterium]